MKRVATSISAEAFFTRNPPPLLPELPSATYSEFPYRCDNKLYPNVDGHKQACRKRQERHKPAGSCLCR